MKIMLVCAGGASTSILLKKMQVFANAEGINLKIVAVGIGSYEDSYSKYDVILLGSQISYQKRTIEENTNKPVAVIAPYDYAVGNVQNIFKQVNEVLKKK